jgi:dGTPase
LNLTWEVREGLAKHHTVYDQPEQAQGSEHGCPSLEAQVANLADEIAYYSHDLDDGLDSGLLSEKQLRTEVRLWRQATKTVEAEYGRLPDECRRYFIIRCITDLQVKDVVTTSERLINEAKIQTVHDVRRFSNALIGYSSERGQSNAELCKFLYQNLYDSPTVNEPHLRARQVLEDLFAFYLRHHEEIGGAARKRAKRDGWPRAICDYLAGMTDRYALQEHRRLAQANRLIAPPSERGPAFRQ